MTIVNSKIHPTVKIWNKDQVNIYDSEVGEGTKIANFVEIGGARIGKFCKIEAFAFIPRGTIIEDYVFIGPHVAIANEKYPDLSAKSWKLSPVIIKKEARIGMGANIAPNIVIGEGSFIRMGSNVTHDVPPFTVVQGNPARIVKKNEKRKS